LVANADPKTLITAGRGDPIVLLANARFLRLLIKRGRLEKRPPLHDFERQGGDPDRRILFAGVTPSGQEFGAGRQKARRVTRGCPAVVRLQQLHLAHPGDIAELDCSYASRQPGTMIAMTGLVELGAAVAKGFA
jgi:hypothetical protein